jgi:hypothetical protein
MDEIENLKRIEKDGESMDFEVFERSMSFKSHSKE